MRLNSQAFISGKCGFFLLVILAFITALFWAKARDPFRRIEFSVWTPDGQKTPGIAVLPKQKGPFPVVVFAHGGGEITISLTGHDLRTFAELGLAAVDFDYNKTNLVDFDKRLEALVKYVLKQSWAETNAVAWVANSRGALYSLSFLFHHPEYQPQLMVRLAGGWVPVLDAFTNSTWRSGTFPIHCPFLLVHGDKDEDFPVDDTIRLAALLRTNRVSANLIILPDRTHKFEPDRDLIFRLTAEYCKSILAPQEPLVEVSQNCRKLYWSYFIPVSLLSLTWLFFTMRGLFTCKESAPLAMPERMLRWIACLLALLAIGDTTLYLLIPQFPINETTLHLAQRYLVPSNQQNDFIYLSSNPSWQGKPLKTPLENVELADYNRALVNWKVEDQIFREFVLSPTIDSKPDVKFNWRRPLWENFYPRIRHETDPSSAAQIIVRFLRERVAIVPDCHVRDEILADWNDGMVNVTGFERIYVAALRSIGVPARLDGSGHAEIYSDGKWVAAPRLLIPSFL